MKQIKVMAIFGTRPEAIKMAPIIKEMQKYSRRIHCAVTLTSQHHQMLQQVLDNFAIRADYDLKVMKKNQKLSDLTAQILQRLDPILEREPLDLLLVQGDTTTTFAASLAGFYRRISVAHVEAGLRTHLRYYPFPEELNRQLTSRLSTVHFAPTRLAKENLLREGIPERAILVSGNTVIDALHYTIRRIARPPAVFSPGKRQILVTAHRRENWGKALEDICLAILEIVRRHADVEIQFPLHLNPNVQATVQRMLNGHRSIHLLDPLDYQTFCYFMNQAYFILSDSGGIQEEAPSLGKPVLVMRNETERPEAIEAGTCRLVGTNREKIVREAEKLLTDPLEYQQMSQAANPFGDGKASQRIVRYILDNFL